MLSTGLSKTSVMNWARRLDLTPQTSIQNTCGGSCRITFQRNRNGDDMPSGMQIALSQETWLTKETERVILCVRHKRVEIALDSELADCFP
jgi:hypothetical protein